MKSFSFVFKGLIYLFQHRETWKLVFWPLIINLAVFIISTSAVVAAAMFVLAAEFPETFFWRILGVVIIGLLIFLSLYLYIIFFSTLALIFGAPFYSHLVCAIEKQNGGIEVHRGFFASAKLAIQSQSRKLFIFILIQIALLAISLLPGLGPIFYSVFSFLALIFLLGFDFLDFIFEARGLEPKKRWLWSWQNKSEVCWFGFAIFLLLLIPFVNLLVFPAAAVGGVLLFYDKMKL